MTLLLFAFIYSISIRYKLKLLMKILSIIIVVYYCSKLIFYDINFKFIVLMIVGFIIGIIWMYTFSKILKYPFKLKFIFFHLDIQSTTQIIFEEIVWRGALERYIINCNINNIYLIGGILFIGIMFAYSHNLKQELYYNIEFYLFSFLLTITFLLFGNISITIGIHICRNTFILNALKEYE